ncbi:MAG TPA: hypothetical protein VG795_10425 [Acidimicrobiia bacterium]|nr:hypothetical protein [Acidimicrobiia bacterium]
MGRALAALIPVTSLVTMAVIPAADAEDGATETTTEAPANPTPAPEETTPPEGTLTTTTDSEPWGLSTEATPSWGTAKVSDKNRAQKVNAIVEAGGVAYLGGQFTKMVPPGGGSGVSRNYLAAIDAATGALKSWNPKASGKVWALELSADGKSLYVGGDFSYIGGKYTTKLAKVDLATGKPDTSFRPSVKGRVRGLALHGDRLYVGGDFTTIGGQSRPKLAAVNPTTGALLSWTPPVLGDGRYLGQTGVPTPDYEAGDVYAVEAIGGKVFAGGTFTNFGGEGGLVTIDAATGGLVEPQYEPGRPIFDLDTYGGILYAVGGGPGGRVYAFSPDDDDALWKVKTDGDNMGVAASANAVYVAGHYDYVVSAKSSCWQYCPGKGPRRHHLAAFNRADGALLPWNPDADTSTGPYTVAVGEDAAYFGGEFLNINFKKQPGFTIFPGTP